MVLLLSHFLRALRWKMLIEPLGYNPSTTLVFSGVMIGYLANLIVPRMGEVTRCGVLNRRQGIPVDKLLGTVITERIADLAVLLLLMILVFFIKLKLVAYFFKTQILAGLVLKGHSQGPLLIKASIIVIILMAMALFFYRRKKDIILDLAPVKIVKKFISGIWAGSKTIGKIKHSWLFYSLSLIIWTLYAISTALVFYALDATSHLAFSDALFVLCAGSLGMVAPVQGGIGAYHFMVTQALFLLGIAKDEGLAYATINHSSQLLLFLVVGGGCLVAVLLKKRRIEPLNSQPNMIPAK